MKKTIKVGVCLMVALALIAASLVGCNVQSGATEPISTEQTDSNLGTTLGSTDGTTEATKPDSTGITEPETTGPDDVGTTEPVQTTAPVETAVPTTDPPETTTPPVTEPPVTTIPSVTEPIIESTQATEPSIPVTTGHTHRYTETVVAATCSTKGYTHHECACGDSYDDAYTATNAKNHDYVKFVRDSTCALGGVTYYECKACGEQYLDDSTFTPPLKHTKIGEPVRFVPATEEEQGYNVYKCAVCGVEFMDDFVDYQPQEDSSTPDENTTQQFLKDVAAYTVQYINQFRVEQGGTAAEVLPGLTIIAEERARQLLVDYKHDDGKLRELCNKYEYGVFVDTTLYGGSQKYYTFGGAEAIAKSNRVNPGAELLGKAFAEAARNSAGHWRYVGNSENSYIAVAISYDENAADGYPWKCCMLLSKVNYG